MDIQNTIKNKVKRKNIRLQDIANEMGISRMALWNKMSGAQDMGVGDLKRIISILNCNCILHLVNGTEDLILIDK
jgi:transcriptional regulator with XRE-family HTH domain